MFEGCSRRWDIDGKPNCSILRLWMVVTAPFKTCKDLDRSNYHTEFSYQNSKHICVCVCVCVRVCTCVYV